MKHPRKNYLVGILLCTIVMITALGVPTQFLYAYTPECQFNQTYSSESILRIALETQRSGPPVGAILSLIQSEEDGDGGLTVLRCTVDDANEAKNKLVTEWSRIKNLNDVTTDPSKPDGEREEALKQLMKESQKVPNTTSSLTSCDGFLTSMLNPLTCGLRVLFSGVGALLIKLGVSLVAMAGAVFESALDYTIIDFNTVFEKIEGGINTGWTALRDIANIVIIGMFAFIAISLILGIKEYGEKKMIARVLVIAVLINFSLLFTKMIIDASNFTAYQFHRAIVAQIPEFRQTASISVQVREVSKEVSKEAATEAATIKGIAAAFIKFLGVTGVADAYENLRAIQEHTQYATSALLYGLLSFVFLLATGLVFLYGTFLVVTRAILLIFLMLTSALAFASYLIPHFAGSNYGWTTWWNSLLRNAALAPLLMIFLWATVLISRGLNEVFSGKGTLGGLATNASVDNNILALLSFVLVLGLLFASFRASSALAGTIAGFGAVGSGLKLGAGIPLALSGRLAGFAGRNIIGRGAARYGRGVQEDVGKTREMLAKVPAGAGFAKHREFLTDRLKDLESNKRGADWVAKRGFRLAGTQLGGQALKQLGVPSVIAGGRVEGFGDRAKRVADDSARRAVEVTSLSTEQKANIRKEAEGRARDTHIREQDRRKAMAEDAKRAHEETEERARAAREEHKAAEQERERMREEVEQLKKKGGENAPEGHEIRTKYAAAKSNLTQQDEKIKVLQTGLQDLERVAAGQNQTLEDATKALEKHGSEEESAVKRAGNEALEKATENLQDAAKILATRIASGRGTRILSLGMDPNNSHISQLARERVTPRIRTAALREKIKTEAEMKKEDPSIAEGAVSTLSKDDNVSPSSK